MATAKSKQNKANERREQHRKLLFSEVPEDEVWANSNQGWCWVPRTMPFILQAIRCLSKGTSAAETYFALWCNSISHSIVEMNNRATLIAAAGYTGPSQERTWRERMRKLEELGFIKIAEGKHGDIGCVLILNPHKVLKKLKESRAPGLDSKLYNTIVECMGDYGMLDLRPRTVSVSKHPESIVPFPAAGN
jgi:hypothetical protein